MNVYTCKSFFPNLLVIMVTLIPIGIGIFYLLNCKNPFIKDIKQLIIRAIALIAIGTVFFAIYLASYLNYYKNIFLMKDSVLLQVAEGSLTSLETTSFFEDRSDSFYVGNLQFFISTNSLKPGYHKPAVYGGVLNSEGMRVRISYVEFENNRYIMSIDLLEENHETQNGYRHEE